MKERLIENIRTTVIGIVIIGISVTLVLVELATVQEVSGWFAMGVTFLRAKDTVIPFVKSTPNGSDQETIG